MAGKEKNAAKQKALDQYVEQAKAKKSTMPDPDIEIPFDAISEDGGEDDVLRAIGQVVLFGVHRWYITRLDMLPESKWTPSGPKCRNVWKEYHGNLSHPDIDAIRDDINECMKAAVLAAIGAGLLTGNIAAAGAAFKASIIACLKAKGVAWASEITIWIDEDTKKGSWKYCF